MNIRFLISACLTVAATMLSFSAWSQHSSGRVALLIGNANYPDAAAPLSTTIRDAHTLADELRRVDFNVELKENVSKMEMQRAIDAFTDKISSGSAALFYFSGYGIQVAKQTYLIPVNAQPWTEADVRRDGINLDVVLAKMHSKGAMVKIVIVDASRWNPFERRFRPTAEGLAALATPEGTLAMYAAAPAKVISDGTGANSLLVSELIRELRVPHATAEEVFNRTRIGVSLASNNDQIPWVASSLGGQFYFGAAPAAASTTSVPAAPRDLGTVISNHLIQVIEVKRILRHVGMYDGPIDNEYEPAYFQAVAKFQHAQNIQQDGLVGPETYGRLQLAWPAFFELNAAPEASSPSRETPTPSSTLAIGTPSVVENKVDVPAPLIPRTDQQPGRGINCKTQLEPIERLICADAELATSDDAMSKTFQLKLTKLKDSKSRKRFHRRSGRLDRAQVQPVPNTEERRRDRRTARTC